MLIEGELSKIKLALQLKYLLANNQQNHKNEILQMVNSYQPFTTYPLDEVPPLEITDYLKSKIIEDNLINQLENYLFIVLAGSLKIINNTFQYVIRDYLSQETTSKIQFPMVGSKLEASSNSFVLKIHKFWFDEAVKNKQDKKTQYCRKKLLTNSFFINLNYSQFKFICENTKIIETNTGEIIVQENEIPQNLYCVVEGKIFAQKNIFFRNDNQLMFQLNQELENIQPQLDNIIEQIIKNPSPEEIKNKRYFSKSVIVKQFKEGDLICMKQLLNEMPMKAKISSELKSRLLVLNRNDIYKISKQKISEMKMAEQSIVIDQIQIRKNYYRQLPWRSYKQFISKQVKFNKVTREKSFQSWLRTSLDLNTKRYSFINDPSIFHYNQSVGKDSLGFNPIGKIHKFNNHLG